MDISFDGLLISHPSLDDAQSTVDLMITCDIAEYGEPDSGLGSVVEDWSDIDLDQDVWLANNPKKQLVG